MVAEEAGKRGGARAQPFRMTGKGLLAGALVRGSPTGSTTSKAGMTRRPPPEIGRGRTRLGGWLGHKGVKLAAWSRPGMARSLR